MFFVRRPEGAHVSSTHLWHEMLTTEPLVISGWLLAASRNPSRRATNRLARSAGDDAHAASAAADSATAEAEAEADGSDAEDEESCCVCLTAVKARDPHMGVTTLHCGHRFHPCCISSWLARSRRCPVCRRLEGSCLDDRGGDAPHSSGRPGRPPAGARHPAAAPRSLFVCARNVVTWVWLHHECFTMAVGYGFDRAMALTGSPLVAMATSAGWLFLLNKLLPAPRADCNPLVYLLGVRSTPRFLRVWTSWIHL